MSNILNVNELYFNSLSWRIAVARVVGRKDTNNGTIPLVGELLSLVLLVEKIPTTARFP